MKIKGNKTKLFYRNEHILYIYLDCISHYNLPLVLTKLLQSANTQKVVLKLDPINNFKPIPTGNQLYAEFSEGRNLIYDWVNHIIVHILNNPMISSFTCKNIEVKEDDKPLIKNILALNLKGLREIIYTKSSIKLTKLQTHKYFSTALNSSALRVAKLIRVIPTNKEWYAHILDNVKISRIILQSLYNNKAKELEILDLSNALYLNTAEQANALITSLMQLNMLNDLSIRMEINRNIPVSKVLLKGLSNLIRKGRLQKIGNFVDMFFTLEQKSELLQMMSQNNTIVFFKDTIGDADYKSINNLNIILLKRLTSHLILVDSNSSKYILESLAQQYKNPSSFFAKLPLELIHRIEGYCYSPLLFSIKYLKHEKKYYNLFLFVKIFIDKYYDSLTKNYCLDIYRKALDQKQAVTWYQVFQRLLIKLERLSFGYSFPVSEHAPNEDAPRSYNPRESYKQLLRILHDYLYENLPEQHTSIYMMNMSSVNHIDELTVLERKKALLFYWLKKLPSSKPLKITEIGEDQDHPVKCHLII